jgi:hypothetical protein
MGLETGITIAREMLARVRDSVQGIQVSAPFGKVAFALQVFDGIAGINAQAEEPPIEPGESLGFTPPWKGSAPAAGVRPRPQPEPQP